MQSGDKGIRFASLRWRERPITIEYQWVGEQRPGVPVMVFLHEGLGSLSMWKDFPEQFCRRLGCLGLVFSRPGYGQSTARAADERWPVHFMHDQAGEVLPLFFDAIGLPAAAPLPWFYGHSDGGSIALLYAARHPRAVGGLIVAAPHIFVEEVSIASIRATREIYRSTSLKQRLARYHADPDSAFWGWNDVWLDPAFAVWNIEAELPRIVCPVLAVQGEDDEYGTLEQIRGIARALPATQLLVLPQCGHSPHRDQEDALCRHAGAFFESGKRPPGSRTN